MSLRSQTDMGPASAESDRKGVGEGMFRNIVLPKKHRIISDSCGLIMSTLLLAGCGTGPNSTGSGSGSSSTTLEPPPCGIPKIQCNDANNTQVCWKEQYCGASAAQICAVHLVHDINQYALFPDAQFNGTCDCNEPEYAIPPCVCEYPGEDPNICDGDSAGDPTTGGGTGDPTTSGGPGGDFYICTIHSQTKCIDYNWVVNPLETPYEECWVHPTLPDTNQPCVWAEDVSSATAQCESLCETFKTDFQEELDAYNDKNSSDLEVVGDPIDCTLDDNPSGDEPEVLAYPYVCAPPQQALVAWGGVTTLKSVDVTVGLVTSGGGSTGNNDIVGYIGYDVSNCSGGTCDVTIDALEMKKTDVAGTLWGFAGPIATYEIDGLDVHLLQPVHGTLNQSSGTITFPTDPFVGMLTIDEFAVDSTPLGYWENTLYLSQATGLLSSGVLQLTLTMNLSGGVVTIALETIE